MYFSVWYSQLISMKATIFMAVIEIRTNSIAYNEFQIIIKRDITGIEHTMDVFT